MIVKLEDKLAYIIAVVNEFAAAFKLNPQQAYRYLDRFKGIDFGISSITWSTRNRSRTSWRTWHCTAV